MRLKNKILIVFICLVLIVSVVVIYLNQVVLPTKIKTLIVTTLTEKTKANVSLETVRLNILKGLVLKNLKFSDNTREIASIKEASVILLMLPLVFKKIVIPRINITSAQIFLERRADNTFNLSDFLLKNTTAEGKFSLFIYSISINNSRIVFQDDTLNPVFTKNIENLDLDLAASLPAALRFNLRAEIPGKVTTKIRASGEVGLINKQFLSKIYIDNFSPQEFIAYYNTAGFSFPSGTVDGLVNLVFKDDTLNIDSQLQSDNLAVSKSKVNTVFTSKVKGTLQYGIKEGKLKYQGQAHITKLDASGVTFVDKISDLSGVVLFNESGLSCDLIKGQALGLPAEAKLTLSDFANPLLRADIKADLTSSDIKRLLKDKFQTVIPGEIQTTAKLFVNIESALTQQGSTKASGYLDIPNARIKLDKVDAPFEEFSGRIHFSPNHLQWQDISLKYLGVAYKISGSVSNFKSPAIQFALSSKDLDMDSAFGYKDKTVSLSKCSGRYLGSEFSLAGEIDLNDTSNIFIDGSGSVILDLNDIKYLLKKYQSQINVIKPAGKANIQFSFIGTPKALKNCSIEAKISSPAVSAYGLHAGDVVLNYAQSDGIVNIPLYKMSLYDGIMQGGASINLSSENLPFWLSVSLQGIKIEKLKDDTPIKDKKDLAGVINGDIRLSGLANDKSKLSGAGKIMITEGRLWELNLFKGLGQILFAKDFAHIVFSEASCNFIVQDQSIASDNLKMTSLLAEVTGSAKVGFDSSINALLDVHVNDEYVPLTGTFKDVTTAIMGRAGRFGVIEIEGTLKEPKYKFKTDVGGIIGVLKDTILGR